MVNVWDSVVPRDELDRLLATGFGGEVRLGERPCLLVVDVTMSFLGRRPGDTEGPDYATGCGPEGWRRMPAILAVLEAARAAGIPRVLTCGSPEPSVLIGGAIKLTDGGEKARRIHAAPFPEEIQAEAGELVLEKTKASAFFGTPLLTFLHQRGVDSLIVIGTTTSGCVRATVVDGASHGYPVLVAEDACFDRSPFAHASNLFDIQMKYGTVLTSEELIGALREPSSRTRPAAPDEAAHDRTGPPR